MRPLDFALRTASRLHMMFADGSLGGGASLILATGPPGRGLQPFHRDLVQPFVGERALSLEGASGRCYKSAALCKWTTQETYDTWDVGQWAVRLREAGGWLARLAQKHAESAWRRSSTMVVVIEGGLRPTASLLNAQAVRPCRGGASPRRKQALLLSRCSWHFCCKAARLWWGQQRSASL